MLLWYLTIPLYLICLELVIMVLFKYVKKNYTKKQIKRFVIGNLLAMFLIIGILFSHYNYNHLGKNEIGFFSQQDVKEATELLDKDNLNYKVLIGKKIRMQNFGDIQDAVRIMQKSGIGFELGDAGIID
ncbi:MAG TPA: hypothetical protein GXX75_05595 [Clostridiales bacterium]|nr:hypothetical protein [Clostridiales bacterium]